MTRIYFFVLILFVLAKHTTAQVYGEALVTWDFSNGIPESWEIGVTSTNGVAQWEYRGPNTIPNINEGARGSCSAIAVPISSQTQSNGFILFDGNYWDDPGTACGAGFGTGADPAPHTAWFITNPIDLSGINAAVLTFQQQYRHFQATTTVQISIDNGETWTEIISNPGIQSASAEWKSINISEWGANQPNVRFKFQYQGTYYWWLLDDINVYQPNDNDIQITKVQYTNNQLVNGLTTLNDLEYNQYPLNMIPSLKFKADALNVGAFAQTGVRLNARVIKDGVTEVYNQNNSSTSLAVSASANLSINGTFTPTSGVGDYKILYRILQDSIDDSPETNKDSLDFKITPFTYAKDEGPLEDYYMPSEFFDLYQASCGNFYQNKSSNRYCHTVQVGLSEGTAVGKEIRGVIYNQSLDTLIGYTQPYIVNYGDLNEPGEERLIFLDFETPFQLEADSIYFVAVEELDSILPFYVGRSGKSFGESSLIRYDNINASIVSTKSFMVRLSILPLSQNPGCTDIQALNYDPSALIDDGSCDYLGCTNEDADNYNADSNFDDGSCALGGCIDSAAFNYNPLATYQNVNCIYRGCTSSIALNYDSQANEDDGSCEFLYTQINVPVLSGCPPFQLVVSNNNEFTPDASCIYSINGQEVFNICSSEFDYTFEEPGIYELHYEISIDNAFDDTTLIVEVFEPSAIPSLTYDELTHQLECGNCNDPQLTWLFNGTLVAQGENTTFDAEIDGITQNGNYQLITTNELGCSTPSDIVTVVQPHLTLSIANGCAPLTVYFNNLTDTIDGLSCTLNTGVSVIENFTEQVEVIYESAAEYTPTLECSTQLAAGTVESNINVFELELPILTIDETAQSVVCENADAFSEITWNVDGVISSGGNSQPLGGDVYQIQAYNSAGCGGSNLLIVNHVKDSDLSVLHVFPNPADNHVQINTLQEGSLRLFNSMGEIVAETTLIGTSANLPTNHLTPGFYFLQYQGNSFIETIKIEIQH
jgi:hypothetical protein